MTWSGKETTSEAGAIAITGAGARPVPLTATLAGDPAALLAIETLAVLEPVVVGANCTVKVQEPRGATVAQLAVFASKNCPGSTPVRVIPDTTRLLLPVLVTVID